jgi:hypothetical protein
VAREEAGMRQLVKTFGALFLQSIAVCSTALGTLSRFSELDVSDLLDRSQLVCAGRVIRVDSIGQESIVARPEYGGSASRSDVEVLQATMLVKRIFKGTCDKRISVRLYRSAGFLPYPGVCEGSYVAFLLKRGNSDFYLPANDRAFLIPVVDRSVEDGGNNTLGQMLTETLLTGEVRFVWTAIEVLPQVMPADAYENLLQELLEHDNPVLQGIGLLELSRRGVRRFRERAVEYAEKALAQDQHREIRNIGTLLSNTLRSVRDPVELPLLHRILATSSSQRLVTDASRSVGMMGKASSALPLRSCILRWEDAEIRYNCLVGLYKIAGATGGPVLEQFEGDPAMYLEAFGLCQAARAEVAASAQAEEVVFGGTALGEGQEGATPSVCTRLACLVVGLGGMAIGALGAWLVCRVVARRRLHG